ncbi:Cna B-type domain-containing protein [Amphibacillus indicireducens]|uniref:Gram-positive cocci surface proteins LPxTG domain-containing protein n=1 Tax=Amphibacillus indicireducens TaxID=1076330 RepID=A0ABP7W608_9BACI
MTRKISFFLTILLLMSQLLSTPIRIHATQSNGVTLVDESNVYQQTKFYQDSLFGVAGGFHLVGLNSVKNNVHINGNILTDKLIYGSDFGTSGVEEANYIRNIESGMAITVGGHEASILVLGKEVEVGTVDNGNAWSVNGNKVNRPYKNNQPNQLWQDDEREFIDLNQVEQHVIQLVSKLAKLENSSIEINNRDHNKQEIIVSNNKNFNVYHLKKGDFSFSTPIHIKGFEKNKASTLIINVDMNQMDNKNEFIIPNSVAHYSDGSSVSIGHVTKWSNANVVWNIYDSSTGSNLYAGTIKNSAAVTGSILAPKATVILDHNLNGTVIAEDIIINGETHRDDYVNPEKDPEPKTTQVAVEKVWEGKAQDSVTINLLVNGVVVDSVKLSDLNDWSHIFTDLPVENEAGVIEYTVEEISIDGYETVITGDAEAGFIVTNTEIIEPETTEFSVEKVWQGKVQDSVTVNLLANGAVVDSVDLSNLNNWWHTFTNLHVENEVGKIEYTVEEVAVDGYVTKITGDAETGFIVTNTEIIEPETTEFSVEKVWEGKVQDSVTINLLANGEVVDSVKLSDLNDWSHTFTDLPVENEQGPIEYTVEEVSIEGYETTITGDAESGFIVTNTEIEEPEEPVEEDPDEEPEDDKKVVPEKNEIDKSSNESGKLLPSTATNVFNLLLIGFVLLLVSGLGYYLLKKKRTE